MESEPSSGDLEPGVLVGDATDAALGAAASGSVVRGAIARGGTYAIATGLIALSFLLVFRHLGVVAFGHLSAAIAIAAIAQAIGDTAVSAVAQRLLVAAPAERRPTLSAELVGLRVLIMPVVVLCGVGFGVVAGYPRDQVLVTALAGAGAMLTVMAAAWVTPLMVELRAARASIVEMVRQVAIAAGLTLAALTGATLVGYGAVYLVAAALAVGVALILVESRWRRLHLPRSETVRLVVREAVWLAVAITVNSLFLKVLTVVASVATTEVQTGLFATAGRVIEVVAQLPLLMAAVAFPLLSRAAEDADHARLARALDRVVRGLLLLVGGVVVVVVVAAHPLITVFAGSRFVGAAPVLQLQAFALLASTVTQGVVWAVVALRGEKLLAVGNLVGLVGLVVAGAVMMHLQGARGGAVAAIIGEGLLVVATLVVLGRVRRDAVPRVLPLLALTGIAVAAALGGLALPLGPITSAVLAVAAYAIVVLALRLVPAELWAVLLRRRSPA